MALSYMQEASIRDVNGNCRCPWCGKYRKRSDFPDQSGHVDLGADEYRVHAHVSPACAHCLKEGEK